MTKHNEDIIREVLDTLCEAKVAVLGITALDTKTETQIKIRQNECATTRRIDRAISAIQQLEISNPWHKVSEELPKDTCEVLICWDTYSHYRKWTQIVMFYRDSNNPEKGWFEDEDEGRPEPDYWMEIPKLPKED